MNTGRITSLVSMRRLEELLGRDRRDLTRIAEKAGRYYEPFDRRREKGKGKWRHIDNPGGQLRVIQRRIHRRLLSDAVLPNTMIGGLKGGSPQENARRHLQPACLVTVDLRNCFPRTNDEHVYTAWRESFGCSGPIASLLTKLTTFEHRLPQGAPTSSILANLTLLPMHDDLLGIARDFELALTMYVDDIALSGDKATDVIDQVIRVIQRHGHAVRSRKVHRMRSGAQQAITGIIVNRKLSIPRAKRGDIYRRILDLASSPKILDRDLRSVRGQIEYVRSVAPSQAAVLERAADRHLPDIGLGGRRARTDETRPCKSTRRHRYGL